MEIFNLVLNSDIDYYNYKSKNNNYIARKVLPLDQIESRNLNDIYRLLHG